MPFVKLDTGILDSTLWYDREAREVFITALLMATPHELTEPAPQIEIRTLDLTGWSVPPGWYGIVNAASVGIIRRAGLDESVGIAALERLASPEGSSRSSDFDGRRLARIDGGFIILNFQKYRDRDYGAAERAKRYRERQASRRNVTPERRDITQAEAEAEAQTTKTLTDSILAQMPSREGSNPKARAVKAINARMAEGMNADTLLDGAMRYAAYIRARDQEGTRFVMQAATFFGPDKHFLESWRINNAKDRPTGKSVSERATAARRKFEGATE